MVLDAYQPSPGWFAHNPDGIHGIRHVARVLVWADRLAEWTVGQGHPVDIEVVRWAAVLHDVGRLDDGRDPEHGKRSAEWLSENHSRLFPGIDRGRIEAIQYCCTWHVPSDTEIPEMTSELKCLKDADGLDRVRLGDLKPSYLRTSLARALTADAQVLLDATRQGTGGSWGLVRAAAIERGWWR